MLILTFDKWASSSKKADFVKLALLSIIASLCDSGASMQPINPFRDFSKLRLEQPKPFPLPMPLQTTARPNMNYYYSTGTAATEDVGVMFKPNHPGNENMNSLNSYSQPEALDEEDHYEMSPSAASHPGRPSQGEDEMHMPMHDSGGAGGGGHGINSDYGGNGYKNPQFEKQTVNNPEVAEGLPFSEDMVFIPTPPSASFIAEIEYDSATGTLHEKGVGGLYDNDQDSSDYLDNNQDQDHERDNNEQEQYKYGFDQRGRGPGENNDRFNGYENGNRNREYAGDY